MAKKQAKVRPQNTNTTFRRLFWAARQEQDQLKAEATRFDPNYRAAVTFAQANGWQWAEVLLEASRLDRAGAHRKALQLLAECEPSIPDEWRGLFHFLQASALFGEGEYDSAINAYRSALDQPTFDKPGHAWHNLGVIFAERGNFSEAVDAYQRALEDKKLQMPGRVWVNLGNVLLENRKHDQAIEAYREALKTKKSPTVGYAWNNLGAAFSAKGDFNEAVNAYKEALDLPEFDRAAKAWASLGQTYVKTGKRQEAEDAFNSSLNCPDPTGREHSRARIGLFLLKSSLNFDALSADDRSFFENDTSTGDVKKIEDCIIDEIRTVKETQYEKYLDRKRSGRDDTLSILRGWSSAVTLLDGSERRWRGGGYFLKWRGRGIVIDPGFDFLRNFHDAGYHGEEINVVMISHNHPDHKYDMGAIDDLQYELYKRQVGRSSGRGKGAKPYLPICDEDSARVTGFSIDRPKHRHHPVHFCSGFPQPIDLRQHAVRIPVRVIPFCVKHGIDVPNAMGFILELVDEQQHVLRIGYTGDTEYFSDLHTHLADCDVLIAHISEPDPDELQDKHILKRNHLGYQGTVQLLKECKPKLALIGEFWAGHADLRMLLARGLKERSGVNPLLPAGIGMNVRLPSLEIECTKCSSPTQLLKSRLHHRRIVLEI